MHRAETLTGTPARRLSGLSPETLRAGLLQAVLGLLYLAASMALLLALWQLAATFSKDLAGPKETFTELVALLKRPFYDNGPNDKGIGIQIGLSLMRVGTGWLIGSAIAIPLGILMGASKPVMRIMNPLVQILRPVSPLAWYPIGLAVLKDAPKAVTFAIVITSLWPTLINTMVGVASLPDDYRNIARVFRFSVGKYLRRILLPYALPHILTGLRLSMGIAWMVIVAGEMLAGGTGIGFFVWDSWNASSLPRVVSAILLIGVIGLLLDRALDFLAQKASYKA
jgi:nitrate/nitrite transport system permease protein